MASPIPSSTLQGHCSVIDNNILYVYSPNAFQALSLTQNATWTTLTSASVAVSGASCVKQTVNGTGGNVMWVVGGTSNSSSYPGLQRYSFQSKTWDIVSPVVNVTQNRQNHAAAFLDSSSSILVYAGSQNNIAIPSSQTFVISTLPPYSVQAFTSANPPALQPQLLQWNSSAAMTVGGLSGLRQLYQFTTENGWQAYDTILPVAPKGRDLEQSVLVTGTDGSKVLAVYDVSVSPNTVSEYVLQEPDGSPAPAGVLVGQNTTRSRRDLTLNSWPIYNNSYAPTAIRSGFSIAQNTDGTVAIAGGNAQDPVALFNGQSNAWVNTSQFFGVAALSTATTTSTSPPTSSTTASSHATASPSTAAAASSNNSHARTSLILGATLGSILGFIALLILVLLLVTWRRRKRRQEQEEREKDERRLSFADQGAPFMVEAGGAINKPNLFSSPHSSIAIISGRVGPGHVRNGGLGGSDSSTSKLVTAPRSRLGQDDTIAGDNSGMARVQHEADGTTTILPPSNNPGLFAPVVLNESQTPSHLHSVEKRSRNSGWSGYFASAPDRPKSSRVSSRTSLQHVSEHDCKAHGPTEIPPLGMGENFERRMSEVVMGTPNASTLSLGDGRMRARRGTLESGPSSSTQQSSADDTVFTRPMVQNDRASSVYTHSRGASEQTTGPSRAAGLSPLSTNVQTARQSSGSAIWPMSSEPRGISTATPVRIKKYSQSPKQDASSPSDMSWVNLGSA